MTSIKKLKNNYEITVTNPAWRFLFWKFPEKVRTYVGDCTVWHCRETKQRAGTLLEGRFSTLIALREESL